MDRPIIRPLRKNSFLLGRQKPFNLLRQPVLRPVLWIVILLLAGCVDGTTADLPAFPFFSNEPLAVTTTPLADPDPASPESPFPSPVPTLVPTAVPATAIVTPTSPPPTADPNLPPWTVLIYMAADNDLDPQAIFNLNQLESTGSTAEVNVVVQIDRAASGDWSTSRRYFITKDDDPQQITSTLLEEMGELNTGDPQTLTDFIVWGRSTYPAQKTALIMWNHGIGWSGIATDETDRNILTLPEFETALADAVQDDQLALIGFDACLMGQLDVYAALAPFAGVAVASEELTPAQGWPYDDWLTGLTTDPSQGPASLGEQTVAQFIDTYSVSHPFSTMAAIDLGQINGVLRDFQLIVDLGAQDLPIAAADLTLARSGAEQFARAYGIETDRFAAVDLGHMGALLNSQAVADPLREAGGRLTASINKAVIASGSGLGFENASGIALYFPSKAESVDPRYEIQSGLTSWAALLPAILNENAANLPLPTIIIASDMLNQSAGVLKPLFLEFQITGRQIEEVDLIAGRYEPESGRREVIEIDPLLPEPTYLADGSHSLQWRDGLHEDFYVWSTKVTYLTDENNGQFVIMWPLDEDKPNTRLRSVSGSYLAISTGQSWRANIVFDTETRQIQRAWATGGGGAPFEFDPAGGDHFTPDRYYLDDANQLVTEPGETLILNGDGQLRFDWRPVPSGDYFIGFQVTNGAGSSPQSTVDVNIDNPADPIPWQAYLDPYLGFQFLYPADWYRPTYSGDRLFTTSQSGDSTLQIIVFPDLVNLSPEALRLEAMTGFGLTTDNILYRDTVTIAGQPAERIAYGYAAAQGQRIGELTAFVRDGVGYVIDLDGPAEAEQQTIETWDRLINNWAYLPVGRGLFPNRWATVELTDLAVIQPDTFVYEPAAAGWERFSLPEDSRIFMALHVDPIASGDQPSALLDRWTSVARSGVDNFAILEPGTRRFALGGRLWFRRDFSYVDSSGEEIWGFIMVSQEGERLITAWTEAPQIRYAETETAVFEVMLAELQTIVR